jgi:hypothetical protein
LGRFSVTATVVNDDALPIAWVTDNPAKFSVTTYKPMSVVEGDAQSGQILDALPVPPSVKLVDSTGKARVGVPLTFIAVTWVTPDTRCTLAVTAVLSTRIFTLVPVAILFIGVPLRGGSEALVVAPTSAFPAGVPIGLLHVSRMLLTLVEFTLPIDVKPGAAFPFIAPVSLPFIIAVLLGQSICHG